MQPGSAALGSAKSDLALVIVKQFYSMYPKADKLSFLLKRQNAMQDFSIKWVCPVAPYFRPQYRLEFLPSLYNKVGGCLLSRRGPALTRYTVCLVIAWPLQPCLPVQPASSAQTFNRPACKQRGLSKEQRPKGWTRGVASRYRTVITPTGGDGPADKLLLAVDC